MNEDPRSLDAAPADRASPLAEVSAGEAMAPAEASPSHAPAGDAAAISPAVVAASAEGESTSLPSVDPKAETGEWAPSAEQPPPETKPLAESPAPAEPGPSAESSPPDRPDSGHAEASARDADRSVSEVPAPAPAPALEAAEPVAEAPPTVAARMDASTAAAEPPSVSGPASDAKFSEEIPSAPAPAAEKPARKKRSAKARQSAEESAPVAVAEAPGTPGPTAELTTPATDAPAATEAPATAPPAESKKKWYVIKVASNREEAIKAAIERRVKIEGLEEYFGQIVIPVERVTQVKKVTEKRKDTGEKVTKEKRVVKEHKKYPGYLFAEVEFNDRILYLFRETSGVGDFVGASLNRVPTPMTEKEVQAMLHGVIDAKDKGKGAKTIVKLDYEKGDKVRIREGAFANSEGEVKSITEPKDPGDTPKVTVVVTIWGRPVDVELDYWQVDKV